MDTQRTAENNILKMYLVINGIYREGYSYPKPLEDPITIILPSDTDIIEKWNIRMGKKETLFAALFHQYYAKKWIYSETVYFWGNDAHISIFTGANKSYANNWDSECMMEIFHWTKDIRSFMEENWFLVMPLKEAQEKFFYECKSFYDLATLLNKDKIYESFWEMYEVDEELLRNKEACFGKGKFYIYKRKTNNAN